MGLGLGVGPLTERFYPRERDRLPVDDSINPRDLGRQVAWYRSGNAMAP